jgi:hypothetical protein
VHIQGGARPAITSALRSRFDLGDVFGSHEQSSNFVALHAQRALRTSRSWNALQAFPASISSLATVFGDTSTTRAMEFIDDPSQSIERDLDAFGGHSGIVRRRPKTQGSHSLCGIIEAKMDFVGARSHESWVCHCKPKDRISPWGLGVDWLSPVNHRRAVWIFDT